MVITDTLGTGLSYDTATGLGLMPWYGAYDQATRVDAQFNGNSFSYTIGNMSDTEYEKNYIYYANVDYANLTGMGTSEEVSNGVTVKSDEDQNGDVSSTDSAGMINYTPITKASVLGTDGDITWTITFNDPRLASVAGAQITDQLTDGANITSYSGDGISITKTDKDGAESSSSVSWADLGVTDSSKTFTYQIPEGDTAAYKYVITYTTHTDNSALMESVKVGNKATEDKLGNSATSGQKVEPGEGRTLEVSKKVTSYSWDNITW